MFLLVKLFSQSIFAVLFASQIFAADIQKDTASHVDSTAEHEKNLSDSLKIEKDTLKADTLPADSITEDSVLVTDSQEDSLRQIFFKTFGTILVASPHAKTQQQIILSKYSVIINRALSNTLKKSRLYSSIEPIFGDTIQIMIFVDSCKVVDLNAPFEEVESLMQTVFEGVEFPCEFNNVSSQFGIVFSGSEFKKEQDTISEQPEEAKYFHHIGRHSFYNFYVKGGWENNALYSFKPALAGIASFYRGAIIDSVRLFQDFNRTVSSYTVRVGALLPFEFFESISVGGSGSISLMRESLEAVVMYRGTNRFFSERAQYRMLKYSIYLSIFYRFSPYFIRLDAYDALYFKFAYGKSYNSLFEFERQRDSHTVSRISGELVSDGIYDFSLLFFRQPSRLKYSLEIGYRTEFISAIRNERLGRNLVYRDFFPELSESPVELHLSGIYFRLGIGF